MRNGRSRGLIRRHWPVFGAPAPLSLSASETDRAVHKAWAELAEASKDQTIDVRLLERVEVVSFRERWEVLFDSEPKKPAGESQQASKPARQQDSKTAGESQQA